jgi:hypothetical protein
MSEFIIPMEKDLRVGFILDLKNKDRKQKYYLCFIDLASKELKVLISMLGKNRIAEFAGKKFER